MDQQEIEARKRRHDDGIRKLNEHAQQHVNDYAKQLNKALTLAHDFDMPIKLTSDNLHEAIKHYETDTSDVTLVLSPFYLMDERTFSMEFEEWIRDFIRTFRAALRPGNTLN